MLLRTYNVSGYLRILVICFVLTGFLVSAPPAGNSEVLPIRTYTTADGIGSSLVTSLMRDSRGFLWFCTRDGLTRFDGQQFTTYQVGEKEAAPGIEYIFESRSGVYWITTTSGLHRFDPKTTSTLLPERTILNAEYLGPYRGLVREDRNGQLWLLSRRLFRIMDNGGSVTLQEVELGLPKDLKIELDGREMVEADDGSLWILTTLGLVRLLPDGNRVVYRMSSSITDLVFSMTMDAEGRIWVTRSSGIYILRPESLAELSAPRSLKTRYLDKAQLRRHDTPIKLPETAGEIIRLVDIAGSRDLPKILYKSADGHIWVSTPDSLIEFDGSTFHAYTSEQGFTGGEGAMVEDLNGNLWIGGSKAVARLNRQGLTTYRDDDGLKSLNILVINETPKQELFVASNNFFVSRLEGNRFNTVRPPSLSGARSIWTANAVFCDSQNQWWFLTNTKLVRFAANFQSLANSKPIAEYDSSKGLRGNQMYHMFEDRQDQLWLSTRGAEADNFGLSRWNRGTDTFHTFSDTENFPTRRSVSSFAEGEPGQFWFGFTQSGLMTYSGERFTEITTDDHFLEAELISALHIDSRGRLWVSSSRNGLARIDDLKTDHPTPVRYNIENGLSSNNVRSIAEDNYGRIYAGTARGVDRITPETGNIRHYSTSDGLAGDFVQVSFKDHNGVMWFGTPNGLSKLVPSSDATSNPPSIWFSALRIAGENRTVATLGSYELKLEDLAPGQNNLQIDFFGIDFNTSAPLRYQYMLEGADKDWSAPSVQHTVNYSNLSAGSYRLLVRAMSPDGLVSKTPAVLSFRLLPPIWARWWFITLSVLLTASILFSIYRYRLSQLQKINLGLDQLQKAKEERLAELERVRSRIARDLHDDIGSSLAQLAIYSEVARQELGENTRAEKTLRSLVNTSKDLVETMSDIVWAINPRKDHLHDLTTRMRHFASEILTAVDIDLDFIVRESAPDLSLGANIRREVFLIFKENINNIARHSQATETVVEFKLESNQLTLGIRDNGIGFDVEEDASQEFDWKKVRGGNGLVSIKKRAHDLGGEYSIESKPGNGTTSTLRIPLGHDFLRETLRTTQMGNDPARSIE